MPKLFSYCIPVDDGAAPNPFWNICTLVICKPVIRRNAVAGDWIVGTGSRKYGFENRAVYAMEVTQKMTMQEYDDYCKHELKEKIPKPKGSYKQMVGDCIYDFSTNPEKLRKGVHKEGNHKRDLGGQCALLSDHFYYFGCQPILLPYFLLPIVKQGEGHRSNSNTPYVDYFIDWITDQIEAKNKVLHEPQGMLDFLENPNSLAKCASRHRTCDDEDELLATSDC